MGEEDLHVVQLLFHRFSDGDLEGVEAMFTADAAIDTITGGPVEGPAGLRALLSDGRTREVTGLRLEWAAPGVVGAFGRIRVRDQGRLSDSPAAWVMRLRGDKLASLTGFTSPARARQALLALVPAA